ncbi:universal stress protein [Halomicrobium sp. HM KBTZ05]|nr:universal stress protein [Halomicrobium mukohataei]
MERSADEPDERPAVDEPVGESHDVVLYPIFEGHSSHTFEIARDIAEGAGAKLLVLDLYAHSDEIVDESQRVARDLLATHLDDSHDVPVETHYERTDDPVDAVITVAREYETRLIVFDEHTPESLVHPLANDVPNRISDRVETDAVTVERTRDDRVSSILVPFAGGPHSGLAVAIAGAIARSTDAVVELFHVTEDDGTDASVDELFEQARERLPDGVAVDTWHLDRPDVADAIIEQSAHYDLTIVGEPSRGRLKRFLFGSVTDTVRSDSSNTVLVSRRSNGDPFNC